jgi:hypothetical protein
VLVLVIAPTRARFQDVTLPAKTLSPMSLVCLATISAALAGCGGTPVELVINEIVADNATGLTDELGEFVDWIELHNLGEESLNLSGFSITDSSDDPLKHSFSGELEIAAGGYLLLYADEDISEGPSHLRFKLSKNGESVYLLQTLEDGGLANIDSVEFGPQEVDTSSARLPNGTGSWVDGESPSPGAPNG